ncbi:MAG: TlpA family protein disulfide reductase [Chitinophagales bacterium]
MKKYITTSILFLFIAATLVAQDDDSKAKEMFTKKELPNLELFDTQGNKVDVADFGEDGKITVFSFWATWCTPCKKELNNIADLYEDWQDDYDMEIVAISIDDARNTSKVKTYVDGQAWDYTVLLDSNSDLKRLLNFQTVPYTMLIDQDGYIVYTHSGYVEGDEYYLEEKIEELVD